MEQHNISLGKGIHRSPSLAVESGELSECVNLIPRNGELVNIAPPSLSLNNTEGQVINVTIPDGGKLLCIHHVPDDDHYIYMGSTPAIHIIYKRGIVNSKYGLYLKVNHALVFAVKVVCKDWGDTYGHNAMETLTLTVGFQEGFVPFTKNLVGHPTYVTCESADSVTYNLSGYDDYDFSSLSTRNINYLAYIPASAPTSKLFMSISDGVGSIQPMGNTLSITHGEESPLTWAVWKQNDQAYKMLNEVPQLDASFALEGHLVSKSYEKVITVGDSVIDDVETFDQVAYQSETKQNVSGSYTKASYSYEYLIGKGLTENSYYLVKNLSSVAMRVYPYAGVGYEVLQPGETYSYAWKLRSDKTSFVATQPHNGTDTGGVTSVDFDWTQCFAFLSQSSPGEVSQYAVEHNIDNYTAVVASVNDFVNREQNKNRFISPFFVRYGIKLYDGTVARVSPPILLCPNTGLYPLVCSTLQGTSSQKSPVTVMAMSCHLKMNVSNMIGDWDDWADIIKGVVVSISEPIHRYDLGAEYDASARLIGYKPYDSTVLQCEYFANYIKGAIKAQIEDNVKTTFHNVVIPPEYDDAAYRENFITASSLCYKVKEYNCEDLKSYIGTWRTVDMPNGVLLGLATKTSMASVDTGFYYTEMYPKVITPYNSRMVLANVAYKPCAVPAMVSPLINENGKYRVIVTLASNGQEIVIDSGWKDGNPCNGWAYFPDSSAKKIVVFRHLNGIYYKFSSGLTMHGLLNGAYFLGIDTGNTGGEICTETEANATYVTSVDKVTERNALYWSNAGNPFFFSLSKSYSVGNGTIIGLSASGKALSSGTSFGQFPLYCFCTDGVWPLSVNDEGGFEAPNPATRDVVNNPQSITHMDGMILFSTEEGLKLIQGQESMCISDVLKGYNVSETQFFSGLASIAGFPNISVNDTQSIVDIVKGCICVPDYAHRLLHLYPKTPAYNTANTLSKHYVYSLDSQEWSTVVDGNSHIVAAVQGYPYTVMQRNDGRLMQFTSSEDNATYRDGVLLTRPEAFESPYIMKVLDDLRMLYSRVGDAKCAIQVFVSNDRQNWTELKSLRHHAYKWYRFRVRTHLRDTDALTAITCMTTERRKNKLR